MELIKNLSFCFSSLVFFARDLKQQWLFNEKTSDSGALSQLVIFHLFSPRESAFSAINGQNIGQK